MKSLSLEQILAIHTYVVQQTGGSAGIRDMGRLESAIATQTQSAFGEELYTTLFYKSAALIRAIIADHAFVDGNKRTAMLVGLTLLKINDLAFSAKRGEIEDFAVKVATEKLDIPAISSWLYSHIKN